MTAKPKPIVTADNCAKLLPRDGRDRDRFKDGGRGHVPGLTLLVTAAGSRRWAYIYKGADREKVFLHLGDVADMSLAQARVAAREQRAIRDHGHDPREQRRREDTERRRQAREAERLEGETLHAAMLAYVEAYGAEWAPSTKRERERMAEAYVAKMPSCRRPVSEVRPFDLEKDLKHLAPIVGNRVRSVLLAASRWATRKELLSRDIVSATDRPTKDEPSRERVLAPDELKAVWLGAPAVKPKTAPPPMPSVVHAYVKLLLLCGTRRGETALAEWRDVDLDAKVWKIPAEVRKNRKALAVPLSPAAVALLDAFRGKRSGRVFPRFVAACPGRVMTMVREALAIEKDSSADWRLHDLRRTFATGLQALGIAPHVITAALGQTAPRTDGVAEATLVYTRHDYFSERTAALEAWARHVEALAGGTKAPVVPISRGRRR